MATRIRRAGVAVALTLLIVTCLPGVAWAKVFVGTAAVDQLIGTRNADTFYGLSGWDYIVGKPAADELYGGKGGDTLDGKYGNDHIVGGLGGDEIDGGSGSAIQMSAPRSTYVAGRRSLRYPYYYSARRSPVPICPALRTIWPTSLPCKLRPPRFSSNGAQTALARPKDTAPRPYLVRRPK